MVRGTNTVTPQQEIERAVILLLVVYLVLFVVGYVAGDFKW